MDCVFVSINSPLKFIVVNIFQNAEYIWIRFWRHFQFFFSLQFIDHEQSGKCAVDLYSQKIMIEW